jgi:hypothetical protein
MARREARPPEPPRPSAPTARCSNCPRTSAPQVDCAMFNDDAVDAGSIGLVWRGHLGLTAAERRMGVGGADGISATPRFDPLILHPAGEFARHACHFPIISYLFADTPENDPFTGMDGLAVPAHRRCALRPVRTSATGADDSFHEKSLDGGCHAVRHGEWLGADERRFTLAEANHGACRETGDTGPRERCVSERPGQCRSLRLLIEEVPT